MTDSRIPGILEFWFGPEETRGEQRKAWWVSDPDFDAQVAAVLGPWLDDARSGALDGWADTPEGAVALVLILDQAPRNLFRDSAEAFASDAQALQVAEAAIAKGFHTQLVPILAQFLMMPLMHAEDRAVQDRAVSLFEALGIPGATEAVHQHHAIVERFGRFPHRNAVLGRANTPDEQAFLDDPDRPAFAGGSAAPSAN